MVKSSRPFLMALLISGCALPLPALRLSDSTRLAWPPAGGEGYVALNLEIQDPGRSGSSAETAVCTYRFVNVGVDSPGNGRVYDLQARAGRRIEVFALPAAKYEVQGFVCGSGAHSVESFRTSVLEVQPGRIAYAGVWGISGGELASGSSAEADERLRSWVRTQLSKEARAQVYSAYSLKPIPESMLLEGRHSSRFSLRFREGANESALSAFEVAIGRCTREERETYGFALGRVTFDATRRGMPDLKILGTWSDGFTDCIQDALAIAARGIPGLRGTID
jgi:hypothetical protein